MFAETSAVRAHSKAEARAGDGVADIFRGGRFRPKADCQAALVHREQKSGAAEV
jgi:hypothetical protein